MKLSRPASSSDIEVAREIARRLNRHRRRDDREATEWPAEEAQAPTKRLTPPPLPSRPAAHRPEPAEPPAFREEAPPSFEPAPRPEPPAAEPPRREPWRPEPARAELQRPEPPRAEVPRPPPPPPPARPAPAPVEEDPFEPEPTFGVPQTRFEQPAWSPAEVSPALAAAAETAAEEDVEIPEPEPFDALTDAAAPAMDVDEDAALSPEQMVGGDDESSPLDGLTDPEPSPEPNPEPSPFDDALLDEPAADEAAGPSWDDIVETCRNQAQAGGAMLIDPAGQVFAARGEWPAPGPNAIATKLVSMMEKTLKDAPTRSISAPLQGMQLTAWRVPLNEGLVTVAFIGRTPVRADARPAIDAEIHRGTGA